MLSLSPQALYNHYMDRGDAYHRDTDLKNAIRCYLQALEFNSEKIITYLKLSEIYSNQGNFIDAVAMAKRVIVLAPKQAEGYFELGKVYYKGHKFKRAREQAEIALKFKPNNTHILLLLGSISHLLNRTREAIGYYDQCIALDDKNVLAYNNRGLIFYKREQFRAALTNFKRAVELGSNNAWHYFYYANVQFYYENFSIALSLYNTAIELDATQIKFYLNRALIFRKFNKMDEAIGDYNRAIQLNADYASAYFYRAKSFDEQDNLLAALLDYAKACILKPNDCMYRQTFTYFVDKHSCTEIYKAIQMASFQETEFLLTQILNPQTVLGKKFEKIVLERKSPPKNMSHPKTWYSELMQEKVQVRRAARLLAQAHAPQYAIERVAYTFFSSLSARTKKTAIERIPSHVCRKIAERVSKAESSEYRFPFFMLPADICLQIVSEVAEKLPREQAEKIALEHFNRPAVSCRK